jgi:hypothetical protein
MEPYPDITLLMPGRHAEDTIPDGGDFVVCVTDFALSWNKHQFTHADIFLDIAKRTGSGAELMQQYLNVITGGEPDSTGVPSLEWCVAPRTFLRAIQCLAVAEHRRYARYESQWGGRFLPFRFAAGIAEGLWSADDAIKVQRYGRPAVERLEKNNGIPVLTKELMA